MPRSSELRHAEKTQEKRITFFKTLFSPVIVAIFVFRPTVVVSFCLV